MSDETNKEAKALTGLSKLVTKAGDTVQLDASTVVIKSSESQGLVSTVVTALAEASGVGAANKEKLEIQARELQNQIAELKNLQNSLSDVQTSVESIDKSVGSIKDEVKIVKDNVKILEETGTSDYFHVRYSKYPNGKDTNGNSAITSDLSIFDTMDTIYMGSYASTNETASTDASSYTWVRLSAHPTVIEEYYILNNNKDNPPEFSKEKESLWTKGDASTLVVSSVTRYLWNAEKITIGSVSKYNKPQLISNYSKDGRGIVSITEKYALSKNSDIVDPMSRLEWSDDVKTMTSVYRFLWNYSIVTYTDDTSVSSDPQIIGAYGDKGETGDGTTIEEYYILTDTTDAPSFSNDTEVLSKWTKGNVSSLRPSHDTPYLWNAEIVTSGKEKTFNSPQLVGNYTEGVSSIEEFYARNNKIDTPPEKKDFVATPLSVTEDNKYLWNFTRVTFTSGETSDTSIQMIGSFGEKGDPGKDGDSTRITEFYRRTSTDTKPPRFSETEISLGNWVNGSEALSSLPPTVEEPYLWNAEKIQIGSEVTYNAPQLIAKYVSNGKDGIGIKSIVEYYALGNDKETKPKESSFDTTVKSVSADNKYLWNYTEVVYDDDSKVRTSEIHIVGVYGDKGERGDRTEIEEYYILTETSSTPEFTKDTVSNWTKGDVSSLSTSEAKPYLWNAERVTIGDTVSYYKPQMIAKYAKDGKNGNSITSIEEYYALNNNALTAPEKSEFTTETKSVSAENKYLWNYTKITYSDSDPMESMPLMIGAYGDKGDSPVISMSRSGKAVMISVDGKTLETLYDGQDGTTPVFSAERNEDTGITTIYVDGIEVTHIYDGEDGQDGVGVDGTSSFIHIAYANSEDGKTDFSTTDATGRAYIGTCKSKEEPDPTDESLYKWCLIKGSKGDSTQIVEYYRLTSQPSAPTFNSATLSDWTLGAENGASLTPDKDNRFLWNAEKITVGETTTYNAPQLVGNYALDGEPGKAGKGISSIVEYYALSDSNTTTPEDEKFSTTPKAVSSAIGCKYLWNYTEVIYDDTSRSESDAVVIGAYGDKGKPGDTTSIYEYYKLTAEKTAPTFSSDTLVAWTEATENGISLTPSEDTPYLWNAEKVVTGDVVAYNAPQLVGNFASDGAPGVGIKSIVEHYALSDDNTVAPNKDKFDTTPKNVSKDTGCKYLWNYTEVIYDNDSKSESAAVVIGAYGDRGQQGPEGPKGDSVTIVEYYKLTTDRTVPEFNESKLTEWTTATSGSQSLVMDEGHPFLWNAEKVITGSAVSFNVPQLVGNFASDGAPGVGIESIVEYYALSDSNVTAPDKDNFSSEPKSVSSAPGCKYLWNYTVVNYTNNTSNGKTSDDAVVIGAYGDTGQDGGDAEVFMLVSSSETFMRDMRQSGNQPTITVTTQVSGYSGTPSVTVSAGTYSNGKLTLPYANTYDTVTVTATLTGAPTQTLVLSVLDKTEYRKYFGMLSSDPTGSVLLGDHYYNSITQKIRYMTTSSWVDLENAEIDDQKEYASILSNAMGHVLGSIESGSVVSSYYGYFQRIIAGIIHAETITVDAANINGKISIADVDGGGLSMTKEGIGATSADGKSSWQINANGTATFKNASVTGNLEARKVTHDALQTIDAMTGKSIGSTSMPAVTSKTLWNLDTIIDEIRSAYLTKGHNYSEATINGVAVRHAAVTTNGTSASVSSPESGTSLTIGTTFSGSVTIGAGDSKDVVKKLVNNYGFPIWVKASPSLGGNFNGIYARVYNASGSYVQYAEDATVRAILMPNEGITIHGHSSAWWGSKTGSGSIVCDISSGYAETTTPQLLFSTSRTYSGGTADASSSTKYISIGTLTFSSPSRYLGVTYQGTLSGICRKNGSSYVDLSVKSSSQYFVIYDLGAELTSVELYYKSSVSVTEESGEDEDGESHSSTSYDYTSITVGRFAWTAFRTLGTEPLVITDTNNKEYRYTHDGYSGLHRSDVISSLFGYTAAPMMYSGENAYDTILSTLGVGIGTYSLDTESKITVNGSTLSSLTYMTVGSDRITFENTSGSITFFTTGDTASELKSAYSEIYSYIVLMASTLGVETADIRPKANNTYSIGSNGNVYARGYFNTLDVTTVNGTTVWGAVFN